jgi:septum formation protein
MKIVLGSQSQGRQTILRRMGYDFEVMAANIDERAIRFDDPKQLTLALAHAKADAILPKIKEPALLITSDQVVLWQGQIREKPTSPAEARSWLKSYVKHPAQTINSVVVTNTKTKQRVEGSATTLVWFKPLSHEYIDTLIAEGTVLACAGGFAVEHPLMKDYIERIDGEIESATGLPKTLTGRLLAEMKSVVSEK